MKNKTNWLGILAILLVFGMAVVGCDGSTDDDSDGGVFILTNIPGKFNGNYAMYSSVDDLPLLTGIQSVNISTGVMTLVQISNGSVSLPMWVAGNSGYTRFSGNRTTSANGAILITNSAIMTVDNAEDIMVASIDSPSITFTNGNATISCNGLTINE